MAEELPSCAASHSSVLISPSREGISTPPVATCEAAAAFCLVAVPLEAAIVVPPEDGTVEEPLNCCCDEHEGDGITSNLCCCGYWWLP